MITSAGLGLSSPLSSAEPLAPGRCRTLSVCLDLSPSHGGSYRAAVDVAEACGSPIVSFRDGSGVLPPDPLGVPVVEVDASGWSGWNRYVSPPRSDVARAVDQFGKPGLLFVHSLFRSHALWAHQFASKLRIPYVVIPHGSLDPWVFRTRRFGKWLWMRGVGERYLRHADRVMFSTHAERLKAEKTLGFSPRSVVVRWPVEVLPKPPSPAEQTAARRLLGLPEGGRILLYFGRYHSMKRPIETLQAFLGAGLRDVVLVMAGMEGDVSAEQLQNVAGGINSRTVKIFGPVFGDERAALLVAADAFISWSHRENFCYAAAEAMGAGRPVILSPGNDLRGELGDSPCGWFPELDTAAGLDSALRQFANTADRQLAAMGVEAQHTADRLFSRPAFVHEIQAICNELLG